MIPPEKRAAVNRALHHAFGVAEFQDIRMLSGGPSSALVYRIVVRGSPFLLRIVTRTNMMTDPARHFTSMKPAAEAGLAPHVWYTSIEDGTSITDFIEAVPFRVTDALVRMPIVLRALHGLSPFAKALNYATINNGFIRRFQSSNILPKEEVDEGFARYAEVAAVYPSRFRHGVESQRSEAGEHPF